MRPVGGRVLLKVRITSKRFTGPDGRPLDVLNDFAFQAATGEFACLLGPSGCGKTTILRIILGLDRDYEGSIIVPGSSPRIAIVFQEPRLLPWRTVEENVRLVLPADTAGRDLDELFADLGLARMRNYYPAELSLGLARRAALARAFALEPDLLLMDEPFVSLDPETAMQMRNLLLKVWRTRPTTVVMVTHDVREALDLADRLVFLSPRPAHVVGEMVLDTPQIMRGGKVINGMIEEVTRRFPNAVHRFANTESDS